MRMAVKVVPKSSCNRISGWVGDALKVRVTAAPERGKANAAATEVVAAALGVSRAAVRLVAGQTSARKMLEVDGLDEGEARRRIEAASRCVDQGRKSGMT